MPTKTATVALFDLLPGAREFATVALLGLLPGKSALATVTLLGFPVSKFVFATLALPDLLLGVFASQSRCLYKGANR